MYRVTHVMPRIELCHSCAWSDCTYMDGRRPKGDIHTHTHTLTHTHTHTHIYIHTYTHIHTHTHTHTHTHMHTLTGYY